MRNRVTDENNQILSNAAYAIDKNKIMKGKPLEQGEYKVLAVENNKNNWMQAMAVAPVDSNGEIDTKQIEILKLNNQIKGYNDSIFFTCMYAIINEKV